MMESVLYKGKVRHTRLEPFRHSFSYRVFYGLFDIDNLKALDERFRWFSLDRFNLIGFHMGDYGPGDGSDLRPWVEQALSDAGVDIDGGSIMLLTFPRILGYVFNPLSIWYCYGPDQDLRAVIHEVRNTFGDRHSYVVPVGRGGLDHDFAKQLHVSPFNGMDQSYRFSLTEPGERLAVSIEQSEGHEKVLRAGMALSRLSLTDQNLLRLFVSHPLVTAKVISAIHWEALRLWLKGATFHKRPEPASNSISVVEARSSPT
jgi:DUF1365 family protein